MARRLMLFSVIVISLGLPAWLGQKSVEAGPKTPPKAAVPATGSCKDDVARLQRELTAARDAQKRAEDEAAAARAELDRMRAAERARIKRLESQTGVAMEKLQ